ncbi:MAG: DNA polymerase I, partial [Thiovulaceae bacterium]|nr:DNA polymerase I [Sulfurimonadaceae bacterium]
IYDELIKYEQNAILRVLKAKNQVSQEQHNSAVEKVNNNSETTSNKLEFKTRLITDAGELNKILDTFDENTIVAFDTETTGLDYDKDKLVGFSFAVNENEAYYVPFAHYYLGIGEQVDIDVAKDAIRKFFKSKVVGHNIKFDLHFVTRLLGEDLDIYGDSMILAWLINPESALALDKLSLALLEHEMVSFKDTVKKGETFANVELELACKYAAEDALITLKLYNLFLEKLKLQNAEHLINEAQNIEFPFIKTLMKMEKEGIKVDSEFLDIFLHKVKSTLYDLTTKIHNLAGSEFNINSTKQLGVVLFEHLGLPVGKKTKTGYSTNEQVLNSLIDSHSIIPLLLEYREVYKLFSTYIEPLLKLSKESEDSRIHTSFIQSGTATGRLSSKNPNLQNIPTRTKLGAEVRRAFIASEGKKLVGIDYSQIELRLLAHYSQDAILVDAFKNDKDIHTQTAVALFGEEEAASKRAIAKTVNFGLLYGMGQKKLSQTLDISTKEAKEIIDRYFESFPSVKSYFRSIVDGAKERGYVETLLGRRRYFDFENAKPMFKAAYERESVNTLFQGSASDLIKLSMNKIHNIIEKGEIEAKMLLQIHDELIFEVDEYHAQEIANRFKEIMEEIMELNIPLKVSVNIGTNWGELK